MIDRKRKRTLSSVHTLAMNKLKYNSTELDLKQNVFLFISMTEQQLYIYIYIFFYRAVSYKK